MRFTIPAAALYDALAIIQPVISTRTTLPVLSHVLIECDEEWVRFTGTDLDLTVSLKLPAKVSQSGEIVAPFHLLRKIVACVAIQEERANREENWIAPAEVTFADKEGAHGLTVKGLRIKTPLAEYDLLSLPSEEFPIYKQEFPHHTWFTDREHAALKAASTVMSTDDTRYVLNGVLLDLARGRMVATDGRRVIVAACPERPIPQVTPAALILPRAAVELLQSGNLADRITRMRYSSRHDMRFESLDKSVVVHTRLIDGTYPNYDQVIPTSDKWITVKRDDLVTALEAIAPLCRDHETPVRLQAEKGHLLLSSRNPLRGNSYAEITAHGDMPLIGMRAGWLLDAARQFTVSDLRIYYIDEISPIKIDDGDLLYVQMPVRLPLD